MGAKAWFIAYFDDDPKTVFSNAPTLDREESRKLAERLFPSMKLTMEEDGSLDYLNPDNSQIFAGCYGGVRIIAHDELSNEFPSKIDQRWVGPPLGATAYMHVMHSVVDWFAFGLWRDGRLIRALSVSSDDGIMDEVGEPLAFERPYWDGQFAIDDDDDEEPYPLPFHPLDLAEASMLHHLGFQFEGEIGKWVCRPDEIPIARFTTKRKGLFGRFW